MACKNKILENYFLKTMGKPYEPGRPETEESSCQEQDFRTCKNNFHRMPKEEISDIPLDLTMTRTKEPTKTKSPSAMQEQMHHVPEPLPAPVSLQPHPVIFQMNYRKIIDDFLLVYELLDTDDDVKRKPSYSYSELVFLAIMRSPNFSLPIHEIYRYIETRFSFFRYGTNGHWKNAIRHSLSKTNCFSKIGVDKNKAIVNRSCYLWTMLPNGLPAFVDANFRPTVKGVNLDKEKFQFCAIFNARLREECVMYMATRVQALRYTLSSCPNPSIVFQQQVCFVPQLCSPVLRGLNINPQLVNTSIPDRTCTSPPRKRRKTTPTRYQPRDLCPDNSDSPENCLQEQIQISPQPNDRISSEIFTPPSSNDSGSDEPSLASIKTEDKSSETPNIKSLKSTDEYSKEHKPPLT